MKDIVTDIRSKLEQGAYENEEHVRIAVVARVLQELGWDIWNPREVNAEFKPVPEEDSTRLDFALFSMPHGPSVFIEVKAVGGIRDLEQVERQLRDYNRNNTALFSIITDGAAWRFYYSQTGGKFSDKWFKILDFVDDEPEDIESALVMFLSKQAIDSGQARKEAEARLRQTQREKLMEERLPRAKRQALEPPFPSWTDALVALLAERGVTVRREDAEQFIKSRFLIEPHVEAEPRKSRRSSPDSRGDERTTPEVIELLPDRPGSLKFTSIHTANIGPEAANNWNALVCAGIRIAVGKGHSISDLRRWLSAHVEEGALTERGFHPVAGTALSVQYVEASRAWDNALKLARELKCPIAVDLRWRHNDGAAFPGKEGVLRWAP